MRTLLLGVVAFLALGVGILLLAGSLGAAGVVLAGAVQLAVVGGLIRASARG